VTTAEQLGDLVAARANPVPDHPDQVPPVPLYDPGPAARGTTPLGLPYPEPTDPLADAAVHVKALSDKASQLLAAPGRIWGQDTKTLDSYGRFLPLTGSLPAVVFYNVQSGFRGGSTSAQQGYVFLFVLGGTHNTLSMTCQCFTAAGGGASNVTVEYSLTGAST
jgi:hypothetical protein